MKYFLINNSIALICLTLILLGFYGLNHPIGITNEALQGTIIAKDSIDVKIGKSAFEKQYRFAVKYEDRKSDVIIVNLAEYTEKKVGDSFERIIEHRSASYDLIFWGSLLFILFGFTFGIFNSIGRSLNS